MKSNVVNKGTKRFYNSRMHSKADIAVLVHWLVVKFINF